MDPPFDVGDVVRLTTAISDTQTGSPLAPSSIALHTFSPAGVQASYASGGASPPIPSASGVYYADVLLTAPGVWWYRWRATGPQSTEPGTIPVASSVWGN
jgi:hypothetical protein